MVEPIYQPELTRAERHLVRRGGNMRAHGGISRRHVLRMAVAGGGLVMSGGASAVLAQAFTRTPLQTLGPFYPVLKPLDQDADLTTIAGKPGRAEGQVIHVIGRVLNLQGHPVHGARVEIWQANTHGRYHHPSDINPAPLDPHFEGFAVQTTDADGRYRFKTIMPGAYPATPHWMRPPHIHFDVTGKSDRVITKMYFPGEPLNDKDLVLQEVRANKEGLIATVLPLTPEVEPGALLVGWDIILDKG
jgi:protocatechuate 3,4-dioxygenase beta subunit